MKPASNVPIPIVTELNGLTRLTFSLPGDIVISKNSITQINALPFLLPVEAIEKMAGCDVVFSVGDLISLPKYLRQTKMDIITAVKIFRGICDAVQMIKDNALYTDNLSYYPDHIFINTQTVELKLILFPFETGQQAVTALRSLLSLLASDIIMPDADSVTDINEIADYCSRSDFKLVSFISLLDELVKDYKPSKRKKEIHQKNESSFWSKFFRKRKKHEEQPDDTSDADLVNSQTSKRKRSGTELILADDEPGFVTMPDPLRIIAKTDARIVRLTISINGMTSEAEITGFPCILGRSPKDADVILQDSGVSRQHAVIDFDNNGFVIFDLSSSNGLTYNGAKLAPKSRQTISNGDSIKIGRVELLVTKADGV